MILMAEEILFSEILRIRTRSLLVFLLLLLPAKPGFADDPGITKLRLLQQTDSTYTIEIDIARNLLWTIKPPQLPGRFSLSATEIDEQSGWVTITSTITSSGKPFRPD